MRIDDRSVEAFSSVRMQSLLALLVLNRHGPMRRQQVASRFWPDSTESQARTNLRQALHNLRHALPDPDRYLAVTGTTIQWRADASALVDVVELDLAVGEADRSGDRESLLRAVVAYRGDLLPGCYDDWIERARDILRQAHVARLERLAAVLEDGGDSVESIRWTQQLISLDPLHEASYRRLMRLYGCADRARALRAYHACVTHLERELDVAPGAETTALYEQLLASGTGTADRHGAGPVAAPPMIGRDGEWGRLLACAREAADGRPLFVLVHGEPGIGKSRLVEEFVAWCGRRGMPTVAVRAYQAEGRLPYTPIMEVLRSPVLRPALARLDDVWLAEIARILPDLLVERPGLSPPVASDGSERSRIFAALTRAITATGRPLVLAVDDVQWCDAETIEFLHYLVRSAEDSPLLVVGSARDEALLDDHPLSITISGLRDIGAVVELPLARLDRNDATELAIELIGSDVDEATAHHLAEESEGNPLFLVEMARSGLLGPGVRTSQLPRKVQAVIEARLSQLSAIGRQLAGVAAVIGRQFDIDLVTRLLPGRGDDAVGAMDELWRRGIIREHGPDGYDFSHDKIRDVAYATIGPERRRQLHLQVAGALVELHADSLGPTAATVAVHFDRAGAVAEAVDHYQLAIGAAQRVFAHDEVIRLARRALQLLEQLPSGPNRSEREHAIVGSLAVAVYTGPGQTPEYRDVLERAQTLRSEHELTAEPSIVRVTANAAISRRDFHEADRLGGLLLERGEQGGDELLVTEGHYMRGVSQFWLGRLDASRQHLRSALDAYQPERMVDHLELFAQDPKAVCLVRLALTSWHLGLAAEACALRDEALAQAESVGHPYTVGYVHCFAAWTAADAGSVELVARLTASGRTDDENAFVAMALGAFAAWADSRGGVIRAALYRLERAVDLARSTDHVFFEPMAMLLLSSVLDSADDPAAALRAATSAREIAAREMPIHHAEALRREAMLLHRCGAEADVVELALREAVDVAAAQGAVVSELRARRTLAAWSAEVGRAIGEGDAGRLTTLGRLGLTAAEIAGY